MLLKIQQLCQKIVFKKKMKQKESADNIAGHHIEKKTY